MKHRITNLYIRLAQNRIHVRWFAH